MKKIIKVEFVFENCMSEIITEDEIGTVIIEDIAAQVARVASNCISFYLTTGTFAIELSGNASKKIGELLKDSSITSVILTDINGENNEIALDYDEDSKNLSKNINEKYYFDELNNLYIVVSKTKNFGDFFS